MPYCSREVVLWPISLTSIVMDLTPRDGFRARGSPRRGPVLAEVGTMNMTKRWTGVVLGVCLGVAAPASAQTLPPGAGPGPTPEPLPCAPSGTGVPQPLIPPSSSGMMVSPLSLPGDTPNAFVKPPAHDDHNQLYFGFEYLL